MIGWILGELWGETAANEHEFPEKDAWYCSLLTTLLSLSRIFANAHNVIHLPTASAPRDCRPKAAETFQLLPLLCAGARMAHSWGPSASLHLIADLD